MLNIISFLAFFVFLTTFLNSCKMLLAMTVITHLLLLQTKSAEIFWLLYFFCDLCNIFTPKPLWVMPQVAGTDAIVVVYLKWRANIIRRLSDAYS